MTRCQRCFGDLSEFAVFCPNCAQVHEPDLSQLLNQTVGERYKLYRRLGQGGLSTVFAATDLQTDSVAVVKVSDPAQLVRRELTYAIDAEAARNYWHEMLERMRHEADALTGIDHPNIVRLFDSGMIGDDLRFVAMEFLRGRSLREELDAKGKLEISETVSIALQLCDALGEVHARGIVHRDINPRNVMLSEGGKTERQRDGEMERVENRNFPSIPQSLNPSISKAKLIDFGIAKFPQPPGAPPFTQHSVLSGTVAYASPEQCQSRAVDHRSDIYSLGVMLYELLTGERPFKGRTPTEIAIHHLQSEPQPLRQLNPAIPLNLEKTILRALAKAPENRQQSVQEFGQELVEQLRSASRQVVIPLLPEVSADGVSSDSSFEDAAAVNRLTLVRRRRRRVAVAAVALVLVLASGILGRNWLTSRALPLLTGELPAASPTPEAAIASDSDSLELAAQLPGDLLSGVVAAKGSSSPSANQPAQASGSQSSQSSQPMVAAIPSTALPNGAAKTQSTPMPSPTGSVKTQPQITQAPAVVVGKTPPPANKPANKPADQPSSQPNAASKNEERKIRQREQAESATTSNESVVRDESSSARRDRIAENRRRDEESYRRQPETRDTDSDGNEPGDGGQDSQQIGPKLIQWSGKVRGEREVLIDLPGTPGTLEIPRVYRNRVGMIEPPSASNRWRCARLRVFGEGGISFVVRWWPGSGQNSRIAGH